ncbi:Rossmann-fold NAD(P)-binding domain-containing protein [Adhaeribacter pallidiroseus]|uniref:hypothetical protein n=1 Tax=Adhaeribacter pallidiroseus TaxID=2072847 RepID=UPI00131449F7|nr:hypothetical protein [Adhaeribacter pallidiroseus]
MFSSFKSKTDETAFITGANKRTGFIIASNYCKTGIMCISEAVAKLQAEGLNTVEVIR